MKLSKDQVIEILPHRDPFLFIDEVYSIHSEKEVSAPKDLVGSVVEAGYYTKEDHEIFKGHFPGNPILPGVVQVEMMAQATSFGLVLLDPDLAKKNFDVALLSIANAKFRKPVVPNMQLTIKTICNKLRAGFLENDCQIFHGEELMSEATVFASFKIS
ncbi:MAG: FabA/FabZ family ACP-dehydratase [Bdellovibrionota bacterium]|nr:FabA/FabZ family ACP-dehydratase [Bdellovibrionota bacterium]